MANGNGGRIDRRRFLGTSAAVAAGVILGSQQARARQEEEEEKQREPLNLGIIGAGGRGRDNLYGVATENIVALCDVDRRFLDGPAVAFPGARLFRDYREMLGMDGLDAVVVSVPDHSHFPAARLALERGLHVYLEKPLTHTVRQARELAVVAAEKGLVTQLGTQIHAGANYRRVVELVRGGAVGAVREVHVVCSKCWAGRPQTETPEVPEYLDWNLWLGTAPSRPYSPAYHPAGWRGFWDFGSGTLGDMACHYMDLPFWALDLDHPEAVRAAGPPPHPDVTPEWLIVHYDFPARGERPALTLTWYDGGKRPEALGALGLGDWGNGVLFIGDEGHLMADYDHWLLGPAEKFLEFLPPEPTIPASTGHHREWLDACASGGSPTCRFEYSGPLTEAVLLGNVAYRSGREIEWNWRELRVENAPEADELL